MSRHPPLSAQERGRIQNLRDNYRLTGYEIAGMIGRSKSVVYKYLPGKSVPNWTDRETSLLTEGYTNGIPVKGIARRLKRRSPRAVMIKMCRHRKKVKGDPDICRAAFLLEIALSAGLTPGRAIQKIRTCDAFARRE